MPSYDNRATFGFADFLPDPDDIWIRLEECHQTTEQFAAIIRGWIDVKLGQVRGHAMDMHRDVHNHIAEGMLGVWEHQEELNDAIQTDLSSRVAAVRGNAVAAGVELYPTDSQGITTPQRPFHPLSGVSTPGSLLPQFSSPLQARQPTTSPYKWYCMGHPAGNVACMSLTTGHLKLLLSRGYRHLGGPYDSHTDCANRCYSAVSPRRGSALIIPQDQLALQSVCISDPNNPQSCIEPTPLPPPTPEPQEPIPGEPIEPIPTEPTEPPIPTEPIPPIPPIDEPPIPTDGCTAWYCMEDSTHTQRGCVCENMVGNFQGFNWTVVSGPHPTELSCSNDCALPPPPPIDGGGLFWCVIPPGLMTVICKQTTQTREDLIASGYRVLSGAYGTHEACTASCPEYQVIPNYHFWCVENRTTHQVFCLSSTTVLGSDGSIVPPTSTIWVVRSGPYRTQSECVNQCRATPPPPPPAREPTPPIDEVREWWYCVCPDDAHSYCLYAPGVTPVAPQLPANERICGGPFPDHEMCLSNCQTQPPPAFEWACVINVATRQKMCWQLDTDIPDGWEYVSGPYRDRIACERACIPEPPRPPEPPCWWCVQGFNSLICFRGVCTVRPANAISGPYATEADCQAACHVSEPPTPPTTPPTTPPAPIPPGGGITVDACCDQTPAQRKADEEKTTWRCFKTCQGVNYITGPSEAPHDPGDILVGSFTSIESALSACGATSCPEQEEPPPEEQPPSQPPQGSGTDWNDLDVCNALGGPPAAPSLSAECSIADLLGLGSFGRSLLQGLAGSGIGGLIASALVNVVLALPKHVICSVEKWFKTKGGFSPCDTGRMTSLDVAYALNTWSERIAGFPTDRYKIPIRYDQNVQCPYILPTFPEALRAYLTDDIDKALLECWTKANGLLWKPAEKLIDSNRTRHNADMLVRLWLRKKLDDTQLSKRIRELGYVQQSDVTEIKELSKQYPPYSDIIRLMVRDAADEAIPDWPDSDRTWQEKYQGELRNWGEYAGIPDEVTKLLWRAHWDLPAPTQLYETWHRNRNRGDTIEGSALGQEITRTLQQNDMLPRWIPYLVGNAYRIAGRVDIRRMYQIGVIDRARVDRELIRQGYDDDTAEALTEFTVRNARLSLRGHNAVRSFMSFGLSRTQVTEELRDYGASEEDIIWVIGWALSRVAAKTKETCVKSLKKRFMLGEVDQQEALEELRDRGLDPDMADLAVTQWQCEISSKSKIATASMLCRWLEDGTISGNDMLERLLKLKWPQEDAIKIVLSCERRLRIKQEREEKRRRKEQISEAQKLEREAQKMEKELQKRRDQAIAAAERIQKLADQRKAAMLKAADELSDKCEIPASSAWYMLKDAYDVNRKEFGLTATAAMTSLMEAVKDFSEGPCTAFLEHAREYARATLDPEPVNGNGQPLLR